MSAAAHDAIVIGGGANGLVAVPTGSGNFRIQPIDNAASQPTRIGSRGAARVVLSFNKFRRALEVDARSLFDVVRTALQR